MREILFRGKRADNGKWVIGFYYAVTKGQNGILGNDYVITTFEKIDNGEIILTVSYSVIPKTVDQYIWLEDILPNKTFVNDIILVGETDKCIVKFEKGRIFAESTGKTNAKYSWNELNSGRYCFEVIGNIHDSPELLKGGADNE